MTASPINPTIKVLLLDIEGTTTPIDFVYKVLFPYARAHAAQFLASHRTEVAEDITALSHANDKDTAQGLNPPPIIGCSIDEITKYLHWLMDQDRKTTALKSVQGKIWQAGYQAGELHSQVFDDVPRAFKRWGEQGKKICIYSSGSVLAQRLLFANTEAGDLTRFIGGYFDTNIGAKGETESYRRIAEQLNVPTSAIVFVSDVTAELEAAASAGLATLLCLRPGNHPQPRASGFKQIRSFDEVFK